MFSQAVRFLFRAGFPVFLLLPGLTLLSAQTRPDFNGTWSMNSAQSNFGPLPAPAHITDRITQTSGSVEIHRERDGRNLDIHIPLDGSTAENQILGAIMRTSARWDGDALAITFEGARASRPIGFTERWALAPDGARYTIARHLTSPRGETDQTLVMVRQGQDNATSAGTHQ